MGPPDTQVLPPVLIILGGGACAGKTRLGHDLVRRVPNALLLDKDQLLGQWVDRLLTARGVGIDRDSRLYWQEVRPLEYAVLEAVAFDHLQMGKVVVLDAPLAAELNDAVWIGRIGAACHAHGAAFLPVWVRVKPATAYRRLRARGEARDEWKLAHWAEFLARNPYDTPAHVRLVLDNEEGAPLAAQVETLLAAVRQEGQR